ncbi:MAG: hypothetical protein ACKV2Q_27030 [Planctomycetaceae bacterium]
MNDTPEVIRQQMEETKSQLTEKLESLECQVSDGVQSVTDAFDLPLQIERHPWLAVGGSLVLGYLASEILNAPPIKMNDQPGTDPHSPQSAGQPSSSQSLLWAEMKGMVAGALMGAVSTMISRSVPVALDYLAKGFNSDPTPNEDPVGGGERRRSPK